MVMGDPITIPVIGLGRIIRVGVMFGFVISAGLGGAGSGGCFRFLCRMLGFRNFGLIFVILFTSLYLILDSDMFPIHM